MNRRVCCQHRATARRRDGNFLASLLYAVALGVLPLAQLRSPRPLRKG